MSNHSTLFGLCPYVTALEIINGRWKMLIIKYINEGITHFGQLKRKLPGITQSMLTNQLRSLEKDGIITRTVYSEVPPHVEYSLTEIGRQLEPIIREIGLWGKDYLTDHPEVYSQNNESKGES